MEETSMPRIRPFAFSVATAIADCSAHKTIKRTARRQIGGNVPSNPAHVSSSQMPVPAVTFGRGKSVRKGLQVAIEGGQIAVDDRFKTLNRGRRKLVAEPAHLSFAYV